MKLSKLEVILSMKTNIYNLTISRELQGWPIVDTLKIKLITFMKELCIYSIMTINPSYPRRASDQRQLRHDKYLAI